MTSTTPDETVDFRHRPEHEDEVTPPKPVRDEFPKLKRDAWVSREFGIGSERDVKLADVMRYGWYLYSAEPVMFTTTTNKDEYTPQPEAQHITPTPEVDVLGGGYAGYLNTLWYVRVPDGCTLFITPPPHTKSSPVRSTTLTTDKEWVAVRIPIVVTERTTIHPTEPVAVAFLAPTDLLRTDSFEVTAIDDGAGKRYRELEGLREVFNDPYSDHIRSPKPAPEDTSTNHDS